MVGVCPACAKARRSRRALNVLYVVKGILDELTTPLRNESNARDSRPRGCAGEAVSMPTMVFGLLQSFNRSARWLSISFCSTSRGS